MLDWFMKKWLYPDTPIEDFCRSMFIHMPLIEGSKIYKNEDINNIMKHSI